MPRQLITRRYGTSPDDPTDSGDTSWVLTSTALVALMVPALAFFYGGLVSQKAVVNTMMLSFVCFVSISVTWSLIGYSLAFGPNPDPVADGWLGTDHFGAFDSSDKVRVGTDIPEHAYFIFQLMFATITAAVVSGSVVQRITMWAWTAFSVVWCMLVYVPLARWIFYTGGWLYKWGVLDFAGGLPVETASGVSAFVLAYWLGPGIAPHAPAHNIPFVLLGVGLLWVGWYGFNGGSALSSGYLSSRALANTHLAACSGMATWSLIEACLPKVSAAVYGLSSKKDGGDLHSPSSSSSGKGQKAATVPWGSPTAVGAASGCLAGLVAITPGAGMVSQMFALLIGVLVIPPCYATAKNIHKLGVDDRLECLPIHGVAGMMGTLLVGIFANTAEGSAYDGLAFGNPVQLWKQFAALMVTLGVCIVGTSTSYWVVRGMGTLAGLPVRVSEEHEHDLDVSLHGEYAYEHLSTFSRAVAGIESTASHSSKHSTSSGSHGPSSPQASPTAFGSSSSSGASATALPNGVYKMPSLQESKKAVTSGNAASSSSGGGSSFQHQGPVHPHLARKQATSDVTAHDANAVDGVDPSIDPNVILPLSTSDVSGAGVAMRNRSAKPGGGNNGHNNSQYHQHPDEHNSQQQQQKRHSAHLDSEAPGMTPGDAAAAIAKAASRALHAASSLLPHHGSSGSGNGKGRTDTGGSSADLSAPLMSHNDNGSDGHHHASIELGGGLASVVAAPLPHELAADAPLMMSHHAATDGLS